MTKFPLDRVLPNSNDAEQAVLGAMLLDQQACAIARNRLTADRFYCAAHQAVFREVGALVDAGKPVELVTLTQRLRDCGKLEEVGGPAALADLISKVATTAHLEHYCDIVAEKHLRRQLIETAHGTITAAFDSEADAHEQLSTATRTMHAIAAGTESLTARTLRPLSESAAAYREWCTHLEGVSVNLGRWLPSLRKAAGALAGGEFVVVIADTGVGKTAVLQNITLAIAPLKTAFFELELPESLTYPRFLQIAHCATMADVYRATTQSTPLPETDFGHVWLDSSSGIGVEEIERRVMAHNAAHPDDPFRVVVVDYFQLLRGRGKDRYERFSNEAEAMKVAAKRTNAVWLAISQIKRKEGDALDPSLHDAKETGSIENSAGLVLGLWRDEQDAGTLNVRVLKNTKGQSGVKITCNFDGPTLRITERVV